MTSHEEVDAAREAIAIYAVMARDPTDALDMISECASARVLDTLLLMLKGEGSANTDRALNAIFVGPVERRLAVLKSADRKVDETAAELAEALKFANLVHEVLPVDEAADALAGRALADRGTSSKKLPKK